MSYNNNNSKYNKSHKSNNSWRRDGPKAKRKTMLCENIINHNECCYGKNCIYAHNVHEQVLESGREKTFNIIFGKQDLSNVNVYTDTELWKHLTCLSELCESCRNGTCAGGMNCKHGSFSTEFLVCKRDINKGDCTGDCTGDCRKIHLTHRGLIPYGQRIIEAVTAKNRNIPKPIIINDEYFKRKNKINPRLSSTSASNTYMSSYLTADRIDNYNLEIDTSSTLFMLNDDSSDSDFELSDDSIVSLDTYMSDMIDNYDNNNKRKLEIELLSKSIFGIELNVK